MPVSIGKLVFSILREHAEKTASKKPLVFPGLLFAFISKQIDEVFPEGAFAPAAKFMILNSKLTYSVTPMKSPLKNKEKVVDAKAMFGLAPTKFSTKLSAQLFSVIAAEYDRLGDVIASLSHQRKEIGELLTQAGGSKA